MAMLEDNEKVVKTSKERVAKDKTVVNKMEGEGSASRGYTSPAAERTQEKFVPKEKVVKDTSRANTARDTRTPLQRAGDEFGASDIGQAIKKSPGGRLVSTIKDTLSPELSLKEAFEKNYGDTLGGKAVIGIGKAIEKGQADARLRGDAVPDPSDTNADANRTPTPRRGGRNRDNEDGGYDPSDRTPVKPVAPVSGTVTTGGLEAGVPVGEPVGGKSKGTDIEKGLAESMGANATEMMQKGYSAAEGIAARGADVASTQAARKALMAAKTAGLNTGQSAMIGAQQAGDVYSSTLQSGLEAGQNRYGQATGQFANVQANKDQLQAQANQLELEARKLDASGKSEAAAVKREEKKNILDMIGAGIGAVASLFSDEKFKDNIKTDSSLDSILNKLKGKPSLDSILGKIKPVNYNYKGEDKKQVGITAQDLEKTPLSGAVMDTPMGKVVDGAQLEGANLALIIELAAMVKDLQKKVGK